MLFYYGIQSQPSKNEVQVVGRGKLVVEQQKGSVARRVYRVFAPPKLLSPQRRSAGVQLDHGHLHCFEVERRDDCFEHGPGAADMLFCNHADGHLFEQSKKSSSHARLRTRIHEHHQDAYKREPVSGSHSGQHHFYSSLRLLSQDMRKVGSAQQAPH